MQNSAELNQLKLSTDSLFFQVTYTEDQVVEDEEDTEKEAGEGETEVTEPEGDSKDEGACVCSFWMH